MSTRLTARGHAVKDAGIAAFAFLSIVGFGVAGMIAFATYFVQPLVPSP